MKVYPNQLAKPQVQAVSQCIILRPSAISDITDEELIDLNTEAALMQATLNYD